MSNAPMSNAPMSDPFKSEAPKADAPKADAPKAEAFKTEAAASEVFALEGLDLAALVASRVCHDVISPVGAIVNGLEVLDENNQDEDMRAFALNLIRKSARQASARLQFCRLAFGAAGSAGAEVDTGDAETVARGVLDDERTKLIWDVPRRLMPKNRVKLLLNLVVLAGNTIPRGGVIQVRSEGDGFRVVAEGTNPRVPAGIRELLAGHPANGHIDGTLIQPFYTGLLARTAGLSVTVAVEPGGVSFNVASA
ncbi:histidine phosphotransferase [Blastochloris tepida]|uniref:Histidine phosphotransferase n=2 Tax=Blastochloris tepida TaxID=2233851 RepID=A0A348FWH7_9HYPH|nr:histidine phosphotransferase [Blastochloris tepida]